MKSYLSEQNGGKWIKIHKSYLKDFMNEFGAMDFGANGYLYTWRNESSGTNIIRKRIDRAIGSPNWILLFPMTFIINKPFTISDNFPIIIQLYKENNFLPRPFRFFEAWCRDPSSKRVVTEAWIQQINGPASLRLCKKIS